MLVDASFGCLGADEPACAAIDACAWGPPAPPAHTRGARRGRG